MAKFQQGKSGNPRGRPRGVVDKRAKLREQLAARGPRLLDQLIQLAESGDGESLRFLVGRLLPPARDIPVAVKAGGSPMAQGDAITREALAGRITPTEATALLAALRAQADLVLHTDLEARLAALEARAPTEL